MRILLGAGGTAGHINPAIAIAQYVTEHDKTASILFVGASGGMEERLVKKAGFNFAPIEAMGFSRSISLKGIKHNAKAVYTVTKANATAKKLLREFKPDIVIGTGGYVSGPVVLSAQRLGIKTAIHEQNAFPGVTTKLLSKKVDIVFSAVEEARSYLKIKGKFMVVGNPVRESVIMKDKAQARRELMLDDRLCILSFGGSLGADMLNLLAADVIAWHGEKGIINHIHGYGKNGAEKFPKLLKERNISIDKMSNIRAVEYIDNIDTCLAAADLVICRAGAITISEIQATGKTAIFVPSPNVTENHQYHNAMVLKNRDAGFILEEKDYSAQKIIELISSLYEDKQRLIDVGRNAASMAILDTTRRIYDAIAELIK